MNGTDENILVLLWWHYRIPRKNVQSHTQSIYTATFIQFEVSVTSRRRSVGSVKRSPYSYFQDFVENKSKSLSRFRACFDRPLQSPLGEIIVVVLNFERQVKAYRKSTVLCETLFVIILCILLSFIYNEVLVIRVFTTRKETTQQHAPLCILLVTRTMNKNHVFNVCVFFVWRNQQRFHFRLGFSCIRRRRNFYGCFHSK